MSKLKLFFVLSVGFISLPLFADENKDKRPIGIKIYSLEIQGRKVPVALWYPAIKKGDKLYDYNKQNKGTAYLDAEPDFSNSPYPLIVFSHGILSCGYQSVFYVENLAKAGYVVVAMDHKDSGGCSMQGKPKITIKKALKAIFLGGGDYIKMAKILVGEELSTMGFSYRPKEISELIDRILELNESNKAIAGLIDSEKIGISGHSFGGFTSIAVSGGVYDCVSSTKYSEEQCKKLEELKRGKSNRVKPGLEAICCLEEFKGNALTFKDPRVKASLPLSPAIIFPEGALRNVEIPVMIITGGAKSEVPFPDIQRSYNEFSGPKYLIKLKNVKHTTMVDLRRHSIKLFWDLTEERESAYENFSKAFFDAYLKGDKKSLDYIKEPHYPFVELQCSP